MARPPNSFEAELSHHDLGLVRFSEVVDFVELPVPQPDEEEYFLEIVPSAEDSSTSTSEDDDESSHASLKTFYAMVDATERRRTLLPSRFGDVGSAFLLGPQSSRILRRRSSNM
mmetsp:Transcript_12270/g.33688  ORF Transcript_12270/g.33688 Transcript_12270/m.33688 type:complete len:114 (-) Transcript_12270:508-849(-)